MTRQPLPARAAGLNVPLFSIPTRRSWGIGEIGDLVPFGRWLDAAGFRILQLLPISEIGAGETSPYSAISAMAIDPIYVSLPDVHDFAALGGEPRLDLSAQAALRSARAASRLDYPAVRRAKDEALRLSFSWFWDVDWCRTTARAGTFAMFCSWEDWWLGDFALYRALRERFDGRSWVDWPEPLRARDPRALDEARDELQREILFHQYVQWVADDQWQAARDALGAVHLFGDFPFMVSTDSADVWARQDLFHFDATVGTPPDAFSATGQDWGLPVYNWDRMAADDDQWLRKRAKRAARLFDGYRIDHLVGFYRTYCRPLGSTLGEFTPPDEADQLAQGERLMRMFQESGVRIIAEDLGSIPDFVRASLARLGLPGFKVVRWEREWKVPGEPFRDPRRYPACSVVTTSTHDIEPLAVWWADAPPAERGPFVELLRTIGADVTAADLASPVLTPTLRDAILDLSYHAASDTLLVPIQDVFGWPDRINTPATVGEENWTWRLPWPADTLDAVPEAMDRAAALARWAADSGRA